MSSDNGEAPEHWLEMHGSALYRFALVRLRDPVRAEDVVQETLLAALEARDRFAGTASIRTWLIGILKHKIIDQLRHEQREATVDVLPEEAEWGDEDDFFEPGGHWHARYAEWGDPEDAALRAQFLRILQACMDLLPPKLARLFMLREVLEEPTELICHELGISATNVWTMLYRARLRLRLCLDENGAGRG
jgi:RNA polymerase sigma-70 factor (ECF subfamily)